MLHQFPLSEVKRMSINSNKKGRTARPRKRPASPKKLKCIGFQSLMEWQIKRYRHAVEKHRRHLSKTRGRKVEWREAERDFGRAGYTESAEKWRHSYCGKLCPHRADCLLAAQLSPESKPAKLLKTG
jgi:hypothetical protein